MAVRALLRSPAAVVWTLFGALAVGSVSAVGWQALAAVRQTVTGAGPGFLVGFGELLTVAVAVVVIAVIVLVWYPFAAAVAYAVGRTEYGSGASVSSAGAAVYERRWSLYRWLKTRLAVGDLADRLLDEDDVAQKEVGLGCAPFVVPALVLDSATLPEAVGRANRVTPTGGRERVTVASLGLTAVLTVGTFGGGFVIDGTTWPLVAALAVGVFGFAITAAVDAAWRASTYVNDDGDGEFYR
jgi:hypothetical protein